MNNINIKSNKNILQTAKKVIFNEINAIKSLLFTLNKDFINALNLILSAQRVVITGIGKSGIIAKKISATFSSTGTPSIYIHPVEALHGDMGVLNKQDVIIALSNSGQTEEINKFILLLKRRGFKIISITNNPLSKMAKFSNIVLNLKIKKEACPYNIVPTSSTTAMLVLGDALAITLMKIRGFDSNDFASIHPGGNLGRLLNLKVSDIMRRGKDNPLAYENDCVEKVLKLMTKTTLGAISIVNKNKKLKGFFTDGDLRRKVKEIKLSDKIKKHMTVNPIFIYSNSIAMDAVKIIQEKKIDNIPVIDHNNKVVGIIDERDLLKEGLL